MDDLEVFVGYDPRRLLAYNVTVRSIARHAPTVPVRAIGLRTLREAGLYRRPTEQHGDILLDTLSGAPMSTEFAVARFFVPLMTRARWALFVDGDVMLRADVRGMLDLADDSFAVQVVKHDHQPRETVKMDGQRQLPYEMKNWSSVILWNMSHAANRIRLGVAEMNTEPGLWLHQFGWLKPHELGDLSADWNWLEGISDPAIEPKLVHYTRGTPDLPGYGDSAYADEWFRLLTIQEHVAFEKQRAACLA